MSNSIESRCTIGAMASKKASASSPVRSRMRRGKRRRGERPGGDDDAVPFRRRRAYFGAANFDQGIGFERRGDRRRQSRRDRPRARLPAGNLWASAARMHQRAAAGASPRAGARWRYPRHRRSGTNSSRRVRRIVRSCARQSSAAAAFHASTTGTPRRASCQAASEPDSPPPTIWTGREACIAGKLGLRLRGDNTSGRMPAWAVLAVGTAMQGTPACLRWSGPKRRLKRR